MIQAGYSCSTRPRQVVGTERDVGFHCLWTIKLQREVVLSSPKDVGNVGTMCLLQIIDLCHDNAIGPYYPSYAGGQLLLIIQQFGEIAIVCSLRDSSTCPVCADCTGAH